ncbi:helix-turn-helix transcriptional regulator [Chryseobacterium sp. G0201]|uniref:helix-turn-helix transcriptional regulator n=1 Tax=Chryseobacterium sp. G0201 TaxID=2487065 RepID=UPI000F6B3737|nr:hypothetical protein [Chryseobacterium sp. G0201]AZA53464.1 hypothetical protein EG348_10820 [Chryseobacterium sp. G0201]
MFCQIDNFKEIDELLKKADTSNKKYEDLKELEYAKKANTLAKRTKDSERMAKSYFFMARSLLNLELQKESLTYIQKASAEKYTKKDVILQAMLAELKGSNYQFLNLASQYAQEEQKAINLLKNNNDYTSLEIKSRAYANLALYNLSYKKNRDLDSTFIYFKLQEKQLRQLPEEKYFSAICEHYSFVGNAFLASKKSDSALYYLQKSYQLKQKYKDPVLYIEYAYFGNYFYYQKQYLKALDFYLKAAQNIKKYSARKSYLTECYMQISDIYGILGQKDKQENYKSLNLKIQNEILAKQNSNVNYAINIILKDKADEYDKVQQKNYVYIAILVILLFIFFFFLYKFLNKDIKLKENIISEVTNTLQNKEDIITQKKNETKQLQQKVNDSYQEIIELAKNNDPAFYLRFQEVYPEFQKKLLEISPGLRTTELILCAYTFLGFTIKDVADYTFKSVNTVRNRKQNLRKKFNLQTEEDMGIWLRNLIDQNP